jgi:hypothetical protein
VTGGTARRALAGLLAAAALTACTSNSQHYAAGDCDRGALRRYDTACGYWDRGGNFTTWYWVGTSGGYRPSGWHATYPPGATTNRPANAKTSSTPKHETTPPGVTLKKAPAKSNTGGSKSRSTSRGSRR